MDIPPTTFAQRTRAHTRTPFIRKNRPGYNYPPAVMTYDREALSNYTRNNPKKMAVAATGLLAGLNLLSLNRRRRVFLQRVQKEILVAELAGRIVDGEGQDSKAKRLLKRRDDLIRKLLGTRRALTMIVKA